MNSIATTNHSPAGLNPAALSPDLDDFKVLVEQSAAADDYPGCSAVDSNVVIYEADRLRSAIAASAEAAVELRRELAVVLDQGPGIFVIKGAMPDADVDRATVAFNAIISDEKAAGLGSGDHYAKPGANERVWNALEKLALAAPDVFVDYYRNDMLALGALAWLGPNYQFSSQVNVVNPGGEAQRPHRDYHIGFMTDAMAEQYPAHAHRLSPALTLQGAVAHCSMPTESGPTMYMPHSQKYGPGYLAWRRPEFIEYFAANRVQLPLDKGDLVYFNPALFHAAGSNVTTDVHRIANLVQISSAFGRTMETIDTMRMTEAVYPILLEHRSTGMPDTELDNVIAACAEGYAFPTNLDRDPPLGGLTPASQQDLVRRSLEENQSLEQMMEALRSHQDRQRSA